jgi:hypothetical protein
MNIVFITLGVFLVAFAGMAVGVILSNRKIKGSCGGIANIMGASGCDACELKDKCKSTGREICEEGDISCDTASSC